MSTKLCVAIATMLSSAVMLACIIAITVLMSDINDLYDDVMNDMEQIKVRFIRMASIF